MKSLFERDDVAELKGRMTRLAPDSKRQWGKMNAAQAIAHCSAGMEMAVGDIKPSRVFIGRILGGLVKRLALKDDAPMKRNSPTAKNLLVSDDRDLDAERARLQALMDRFARGGAEKCTTHPHPFFGRLTPQEWAVLMYKHVDHHLRQFSV